MRIVLAIIGILSVMNVYAENIKVLPSDPAVRTAVMPDGLTCYVVSSPYLKGMADFALVQNTGTGTCESVSSDKVVALSREGLSAQPRLLSESVQNYFASLGAVAGKHGFVKVTDDATVYHFKNVNLSARKTALDSSLLVLMGVVEKCAAQDDSLLRKWYAPTDQALIIAGDVDPSEVIEKLMMLSYMVPAAEQMPRDGYHWQTSETSSTARVDSSSRMSVVSATWRLPRTPREKMNSVQPLVLEKYIQVAANVAQRRLETLLRSQDIPAAQVQCSFFQSENYLEDRKFEIVVKVAPTHAHSAIGAIAVVMSSISSGKVGADEFKDAARIYFNDRMALEKTLSNSNYVRRCISAFLYNESLASEADERRFLMTRSMSDESELAIFKSIVNASFKSDSNVDLNCITPDGRFSSSDVKGIFEDSWCEKVDFPYENPELSYALPTAKIKVSSVKKEYLTGGSVWTLSNGMRVIVKKTDEKDVVNWSFVASGGYGNVPDIDQGEAAYFSDYPKFCTIGGLKAEEFYKAIGREGMTMDINVGHSATSFSGRVPDDKLDFLIRALLTQLNGMVPDADKFEYADKCEDLRLTTVKGTMEERISEIDSVLCPDYKYSKCKSGMAEDFLDKGKALFDRIAGCADSGILVLIGDVDEKSLKNALVTYAADFRTLGRRPSRPVSSYQPLSGTVELYRKGKENSVDIVLSAPVLLTGESYYTAEITALCLRRALSQIVTGRGMHVRVRHNCNLHPHERVSIMLSLREASVDGFATGTSHHEPEEALVEVRELLRNLESVELTDAELASYKALIKQKIKREQNNPGFWYDVLAMRYVEGKDYYSSFESKIDAITKEDIMDMLGLLSKGSRVEYLIER